MHVLHALALAGFSPAAFVTPRAAAARAGMLSMAEAEAVIMKFGGSSVRDAERIREVCTLVADRMGEGIRPHLVCSAMGKTTNNLLEASTQALDTGIVELGLVRELHEATIAELSLGDTTQAAEIRTLLTDCERTLSGVAMLGELSSRSRDLVVSYGERMSGRMVAAQLCAIGIRARQYESWDLGVKTTSDYGEASVLDEAWPVIGKCVREIEAGTVAVITGFIGKDATGRVTTLGRGGSDLTASLIGAAAGFEEVQVWKDVDGILTADPRLCPAALPVAEVSFEEAAELAYFGAQVLHPLAMQPARLVNMPVRVKNSYNPTASGTLITQQGSPTRHDVTAITSKKGVQMVDIASTRMLGAHGFLARTFDAFAKHSISVDTIASSEVSVSLTLNKNLGLPRKGRDDGSNALSTLDALVEELSTIAEVRTSGGHTIITLIANVERSSNVMADVFAVMTERGIQVEMLSQGASKVNISLVVPDERGVEAIQALHQRFFEKTEGGK
mmetsp:Transcript_24289/g.52420  ORF Transcript_24289/g.52420 Transcript_24289/m.52420 type:complete len:503 (-) Transcript_24289:345-1853(-)|eukprot:CAMPEP_0183341952 /NCGR_PEP_ID=MMETSP0164_2-20130417/8151_1 /TAXON_ID=221442 /ORGANISM="Coccolithus pelagicus ssp braarudi, Strain PLY182g" /LENGTH=502 /DNA_ID=CAMNT_0025512417 /DNA_START=71 /DNA_END=1579 /DNA_ORIENTATION=-